MRTSSNHSVLAPKSRRSKKNNPQSFTKMRKKRTSNPIIKDQDLIVLSSRLEINEEQEEMELSAEELEAILTLKKKEISSLNNSGITISCEERVGSILPNLPETGKDPQNKPLRRRQIDPTTCERNYSSAEIEFMNALDSYKRENGRMFPTCSEILEVFLSLGYVKKDLVERSSENDLSLKTIPSASSTPLFSTCSEGKEEPLSPYINDAGSLPIF